MPSVRWRRPSSYPCALARAWAASLEENASMGLRRPAPALEPAGPLAGKASLPPLDKGFQAGVCRRKLPRSLGLAANDASLSSWRRGFEFRREHSYIFLLLQPTC